MSFFPKTFNFLISNKLKILWIVAITLIVYFLYYSIKHATSSSNGFASYYTASRLLLEGENPANFYSDEYFSSKVEKYVPGIYEIYLINLPTTALVALPISGFDYVTARILWITISLLLLTVSIIFILRRLKFNQAWLPFVLILIFSFQPLYANIVDAQVYIFIFCLLIFSFSDYVSGKDKLPGIIIGLILILKSAGSFLLLLFAIQKKWKTLLWVIVTVLFFFIITLPFFGLNSWLVYGNKLLSYTNNPSLSVTAYQSIHSFFHHLFVFDAKWNPEPVFNLAIFGESFTIFFSLIMLVVTVHNIIKYKKPELAFGSLVILGLILNPASIDYHYMLILIPVLILIDWLRRNSSKNLWILFGVSFTLIALNIPHVSIKITRGWLALFAYPKLYGAVGLWILGLRASRDSKTGKFSGNY